MLIADNKVSTLQEYLTAQLSLLYDERESANVIFELFRSFKQWNRAEVLMNKTSRISESEILQFHFAGKRLAKGEPLQYVLGKAWFRGLEFIVNPNVLIPRPETEELVQLVLEKNSLTSPNILDIGTGSGCIAVSLKKEIPNATVSAIDVSEDALSIAKQNAALSNVEINFVRQDILTTTLGTHKYDVIVSNPPYIPFKEKNEMREQVTEHEPSLALFVPDENALLFYKRIFMFAKQNLMPNGKVFCEIHEKIKDLLILELERHEITRFEFIEDMQHKTRMLFLEL